MKSRKLLLEKIELFFSKTTLSQYVSLEGGDLATRHNLASQKQREDFNWINEMLGEADRLQDVDPYQAGQIATDTEAYLDDLEAQYEDAFGQIKEIGQNFDKMRRKARKAYRKGSSTFARTAGALSKLDPITGGLLESTALKSYDAYGGL